MVRGCGKMRRTREQIEKDAQIARRTEFHIYAPAERARRKAARLLQRERAVENGGVYFIEAVGLKKVKIGYAIDVKKRLAGLTTGCPVPLRLVAFVKGPRDLEFDMHVRFWPTHSHGEWFGLGKRLADFIEANPPLQNKNPAQRETRT
jgi:hypothetical protein